MLKTKAPEQRHLCAALKCFIKVLRSLVFLLSTLNQYMLVEPEFRWKQEVYTGYASKAIWTNIAHKEQSQPILSLIIIALLLGSM